MCDKFCFPVKVRKGGKVELCVGTANDRYCATYDVTDPNQIKLLIEWEARKNNIIKAELFTADFELISSQIHVVNGHEVCLKFCLYLMTLGDECSTDQNAADERKIICVVTALPYREPMDCAIKPGDEGEVSSMNYENGMGVTYNCADGLAQDMIDFLSRGCMTDAEITNGEHTFTVHTAILSVRSPVFRKFFKDPSNGKKITIPNATDGALNDMVTFIYSGIVELESTDRAEQLYDLALKYEVNDLRDACIQHMFTPDHVLETLILAKEHENWELKKLAIEFIGENLTLLESSENWNCFAKENADLLPEIYSYNKVSMEKDSSDDSFAQTPYKKPRLNEDEVP